MISGVAATVDADAADEAVDDDPPAPAPQLDY
jgi:hypothetical protein